MFEVVVPLPLEPHSLVVLLALPLEPTAVLSQIIMFCARLKQQLLLVVQVSTQLPLFFFLRALLLVAFSDFLLVQFANVVSPIECALQFNHAVLLVLLHVVFLLLALLDLVDFLLSEAALVLRSLDFLRKVVHILVLPLDEIAAVGDLVLQLLLG